MSLHQEMLGSLVRLGALALCSTIPWGSRLNRLCEIYLLCSGRKRWTPSIVSENSQWNVAAKTLGYRFFIRKDLTICLRWTHALVQIVCLCESMWSSWCVIFLFFHYVEYPEPGYERHHALLFRNNLTYKSSLNLLTSAGYVCLHARDGCGALTSSSTVTEIFPYVETAHLCGVWSLVCECMWLKCSWCKLVTSEWVWSTAPTLLLQRGQANFLIKKRFRLAQSRSARCATR